MPPRRPLGRCSFLFLLAVSFDVLGLSLILVGVFAELMLDGRSFGDFLIYGGGIVLFFSLLWWLAWYSLNLEVSMEELSREGSPGAPVRRNLVQLARKVTESFSKRSRRKAEGAVLSPTTSPTTAAVLSPTTSPTTAAVLSPTLELSAAPCREVGSGGRGMADRLV